MVAPLLQAQVEPHFLFNTLANIQELVETGAPQAAQVLRSLIAYLRAAVPRLHDPATTLGQEMDLVRAYLEVMHMRMPDPELTPPALQWVRSTSGITVSSSPCRRRCRSHRRRPL